MGGLRGFTEMVQSNYGDAAVNEHKAPLRRQQPSDVTLFTADGLVDLERLKAREREFERIAAQRDGIANGGVSEHDIALQHAVARFFTQQYHEQAQAQDVAAGTAAVAAAQSAAGNDDDDSE